MWNLLAIVPAAMLAVAAVLAWRRPAVPSRAEQAQPLVAALGAAVASGALVWHLWTAERLGTEALGLRLTLSQWTPTVFGAAVPAVDVDIVGAAALLVLSFLALIATVGMAFEPGRSAARPLAIAAGAALFIAAARVPLGLVFGWLALDAALFMAAPNRRRHLITGQAGLLFALAGLVRLPLDLPAIELAGPDAGAASWLMLAAAVRMGLAPFWWAVPRGRPGEPWTAGMLRLAPTLAGGILLLQASALVARSGPLDRAALALGLFGLVAGVALSWRSERADALDWRTTGNAGLVLVAASLGGPIGHTVAVVLLLDLVLARAAIYFGSRSGSGLARRVAVWVAAASLAGLPPTLGFAGRWMLFTALQDRGATGVLLVVAVATAFSLAALWGDLWRATPRAAARPAATAGVLLLAATTVVLGWRFDVLTPLFKLPWSNPLLVLGGGLGSRLAVINLSAIGLPLLFSIVLAGSRRRLSDRRAVAVDEAPGQARMDAPVKRLASAVLRAGERLHAASGLVEGQRALAWTLPAVAATGLMMLAPVATGPAVASARGIAFLVAATVIAAAMLLTTAPAAILVALGAGYVLSAAVLVLTGGTVVIAGIKLLSGIIVVTILFIGVLQEPIDRHLAVAARRLRHAGSGTVSDVPALLPPLALGVVLVVGLGLHAGGTNTLLPDDALRPAWALAAGGALAVLLARDPLRLAAGVLLALAGFEVAYAHLDPGLLITGAMAAFQMLFAIVSSYFVGLSETRPTG